MLPKSYGRSTSREDMAMLSTHVSPTHLMPIHFTSMALLENFDIPLATFQQPFGNLNDNVPKQCTGCGTRMYT